MLVAARRQEILALIERERSVRVTKLARKFKVTEETIRRDLEKLDAEGKLVRSHGGAICAPTHSREISHNEREVSHAEAKAAIARAAITKIKEGDTILVDASTTALQMVKLLPDIEITVLTNAMQVCNELASRPKVRIVCTGGSLSVASMSFVGPRVEHSLTEYHVNSLFFSCTAVHFEYGLSDTNEAQASLKRSMIAAADNAYLLADKSKIGAKALRRFAGLQDIAELIVDGPLDEELSEEFDQLEVPYTVAVSS